MSEGGTHFVSRRSLEIAVFGALAVYALYALMLGKMFSPSLSLAWYRDVGILWTDADHVVTQRSYQAGQFFPPSCYIIFHMFGMLDHRIGFRIYLVLQVIAMAGAIWAWLRFAGVARSPNRSLIVLAAALTCSFYVHVQLGMHNPNAETFALV